MALADWLRSLWSSPPRPRVVPAPPEPPPAHELLHPPRAHESPRLELRQVIEQQGAFPPPAAIALGLELCRRALEFDAGPRRLRGVSARSVFFTRDGGVGAVAEARFEGMAPEEVAGQPADERSDVFLASLVVFGAVTGVWHLFAADSDFQVLENVRQVRLPPLPADVPAELRAVLERGLAVAPAARFETLAALRDALADLPHDPAALSQFLAPAWRHVAPDPHEPAATTTAAQLLARIRAGDDGARAVYADLLESEGRAVEAAWVRQEQAMRALTGDAQLAALTKLRALEVSLEFMASVSRPTLEACGVEFGFRCPRTWDALTPTADPLTRWCGACRERVHFAATVEEAQRLATTGCCFALCVTAERTAQPLVPPQGSHGMGRGLPLALAKKR